MPLLIVHLSDSHFTAATSTLDSRPAAIRDAIKNIESDYDSIVIVWSGDITNSGEDEQFAHATDFIGSLVNEIRVCAGPKTAISVLVVPGNHDCFLDKSTSVRGVVIDTLRARHDASLPDAEMLNLCVRPLETFFSFRDLVTSDLTRHPVAGLPSELAYCYHTSLPDGQKIAWVCLNSAWAFTRNQSFGGLLFPFDGLPQDVPHADLVVLVMHHPFNWFRADIARGLRERLDELADIVLTGHEHQASGHHSQAFDGSAITHLEAPALLSHGDQPESEFNAYVIDGIKGQFKACRFRWDVERYSLIPWTNGDPDVPQWRPLPGGRRSHGPRFSDTHWRFLEEVGIQLSHPQRASIGLSDIYVYPDIVESAFASDNPDIRHPGDGILELLVERRRTLLTADHNGGKTALAKTLVKDLRNRQFLPLLLSGRDAGYASADEWLVEAFKRQYVGMTLDEFRQTDKEQLVIVIDDYDAMYESGSDRIEVTRDLTNRCGIIVALAQDFGFAVKELCGRDGILGEAHCRISHFGYLRRTRLVNRWLALDERPPTPEEQVSRQEDLTRFLNTVFGKNFVPSYPVFILSVLQAWQVNKPIDLHASTHGYFFELLIRQQLSVGKTKDEYDILIGYLSFVSYRMFSDQVSGVTEVGYQELHRQYNDTYELKRSFIRTLQDLVDRDVLVYDRAEDRISFKYPYLFYFFVASFMRDRIAEPGIQRDIHTLSRGLHREEAANVLLFLAHFSRDPFILETLLAAADEQFLGVDEARLSEPLPSFARPSTDAALDYVEDVDIAVRRENRDDALDRVENSPQDMIVDASVASFLAELNRGLKTVEILGQIIKNFPGTMEGEKKGRAINCCVGLGLRVLGRIFQLLDDSGNDLFRHIVATLRVRHPTEDVEAIEKQASKTMFGLVTAMSYGMIKRISRAIGSPHLDASYDRVIPWTDSTARSLVRVAIPMDMVGRFPEVDVVRIAEEVRDIPLAECVLRLLTVEHFYLFPVDFKLKQRICSDLNISYKRLEASGARRKLLGGTVARGLESKARRKS